MIDNSKKKISYIGLLIFSIIKSRDLDMYLKSRSSLEPTLFERRKETPGCMFVTSQSGGMGLERSYQLAVQANLEVCLLSLINKRPMLSAHYNFICSCLVCVLALPTFGSSGRASQNKV